MDDPTDVRATYLSAAEVALALLREPAVAAAWARPSALAQLSVGGLAAHLGRQVFHVPTILASDPPASDPVPLLDHFARSAWVEAGVDDDINVAIRDTAEREGDGGPAEVRDRTEAALRGLREQLPGLPADRVVAAPRGDWSLTLADLLMTRLVEITIHCDDLAVSVDLPTPELPAAVTGPVLDLLRQLATRRHGQLALLRALSRTERAPASISAF